MSAARPTLDEVRRMTYLPAGWTMEDSQAIMPLPEGWRWLKVGEEMRVGDVMLDPRGKAVDLAVGGTVLSAGHHPVRRIAERAVVAPAATPPAATPPAPAPAPAADWFKPSFEGFANSIAARLGGPVYLVGSALTEPNPADIDVRVVLEDHDLDRLFGPEKPPPDGERWNTRRWRMAREQLKQSRRLSRSMRHNIDFQIQDASEARVKYPDRPRLRLDRAPDGFFAAGLGEP